MLIDDNFIEAFQNQIKVLTRLQDSVQGAVDRANEKLAKLIENRGKNIEDVIRPNHQSPAARGRDGKDQR